jgi:hypothetical protein
VLRSALLKTSTKIKMYLTLIRPVITHACETWTLNEHDKNRLLIFERRITRTSGPLRARENSWRIRSVAGLDRLINEAYIVRFIKAHRIRGLDHKEHRLLKDDKSVLECKSMGSRQTGRQRIRWLDDVCNDMKVRNVKNLKETALNTKA